MKSSVEDCGLLQTCYFLNNTNTKHIRVGFFQSADTNEYSLQVRFYHGSVQVTVSFDIFCRIISHLSSVAECLTFKSILNIRLTDNLQLTCNSKRAILRKNKQSIPFDQNEWAAFKRLTPVLRHIAQIYHSNSQVYLNYVQNTINLGYYIEPTLGLSPTSCERIYYELMHHGHYATV